MKIKKVMSLLLATALMIGTFSTQPSFAAANIVNNTVSIEASENETDLKTLYFNLDFQNGSIISPGGFRLEFSNDVEVKEITMNGYGGVTVGAPSAIGNYIFSTIDNEKIDRSKDAAISVQVKLYVPNTGDVFVRVDDYGNTGIGNLADVRIAKVKDLTSELDIIVKEPNKEISFDGGQLSQFEIKKFRGVTRDKDLVLSIDNDGVGFDSDTKVLVDGKVVNNAVKTNGNIELLGTDLENARSIIILPSIGRLGNRVQEDNVRVIASVMDGKKSIMSTNAYIGKIVDYNVTMIVTDRNSKHIPNLFGGERATVKVVLKGPKGSLLDRPIDFTIDGAKVLYTTSAGFSGIEKDDNGMKIFRNNEFSYKPSNLANAKEVSFLIDIVTDSDQSGYAKITAGQRGWEYTADLAKVTPKVDIKVDNITVINKGNQKEVGTIYISEMARNALQRGDKLELKIENNRDYIQFINKNVKVDATKGLELDLSDVRFDEGYTVLRFNVKKTSRDISEIKISGIKVSVDGSAVDGVVKVQARVDGKKVATTDFIRIEKEYAKHKGSTTVFQIGNTNYKVDNQDKFVPSAPYIKNNRIMLPIRAVAESLGLRVQWNGGTKTATFTNETKVASVTIDDNKIYVNGTPIQLTAPAELKNDVTFVELKSLSTAFGVNIEWDNFNKTATIN